MKKILTVTAFFLFAQLLCGKAFSQFSKKSSDEPLKLSGRLALGISNLATSGTFQGTFKANLGYLAGGIAEYRPKGMFGLLGGIAYEGKGAAINGDFYFYDRASYNISYIDVMLGGVIYPAKKLKFEVALVPAFKISESVSLSYMGVAITNSATNYIKSFDLGAMAGVHYEFDKFTFGASYNLGLNNIAVEGKDGFGNLKNRAFLASLSYNFTL